MLHDAPAPLAFMTAPISSRAWTVYNRRASKFMLAALQFTLGDLDADATPSAKRAAK